MVWAQFGDDDVRHLGTVLAENLGVEYAKANACGRQVATNGKLDGRKTVVGEYVGTSDDRKYVDSRGQTAYGGNVVLGKGRSAEQRVGGHRRLENNRLELVGQAVVASAGHEGCWRDRD